MSEYKNTIVNTNESIEKNENSIIGLLMWNKKHPNNQMTMEKYIEYRTQKEIRRQEKLAKIKSKQEN